MKQNVFNTLTHASQEHKSEVDEFAPEKIYLTMLAVQAPSKFCSFLEAHLVDRLPEALDGLSITSVYKCSPMCFIEMADFGENELEQLWVLPNCVFVGEYVACRSQPLCFEDFVQPMLTERAARRANPSANCEQKLPKDILHRLQEEFPWLTVEEINSACKSGGTGGHQHSSSASCSSGSGVKPHVEQAEQIDAVEGADEAHAGDPPDEGDLDALMDALADDREEWEWDDVDMQMHFYQQIRGGRSTAIRFGRGSDGASANARSHVRQWCIDFGWPRQPTFSYNVHTKAGAVQLAREWCRRGHFYFELWHDSERPYDFDFRNAVDQYMPSQDFLDWACAVDPNTATWDRIQELMAAYPSRV